MTRVADMAYKHKQKQLAVIYVLQSVIANPGLRPKNLLTVMHKNAQVYGLAFRMKQGELVNLLQTLLACQLVDDLEVCWEQSEPYKIWYVTDNGKAWLEQVTQ
jgi:hypothetical protein